MDSTESVTPLLDRIPDPEERRARAVERIEEMLRLQASLEAQPPAARPVPIALVRRALFALYREAIDAGAADEAMAALGASGSRPESR